MKFMTCACVLGFACGSVFAQTASTTGTTDTGGTGTSTALADNSPSQNVTGGALQLRAPGLITAAARAAHNAVVNTLRSRVSSTPTPDDNGSGTSGTGSTDLAGLLGQLAGSGILGSGLTSTNPSTTGTVNNSSGTSTLPPEVLALLQAAGIDPNSIPSTSSSNGTTGTGTTGTGTIPATMIGNSAARSADLTGSPDTSQTTTGTTDTTTTEPSFRVRWLNAVLTTVFTGITVGLQSQPFIEYLKDRLRPPTTTSFLIPQGTGRQFLAGSEHGGGGCRLMAC